MAQNTDGVNIIITGDASQVIRELEATEKAIANVKGSQINITANSSQAVGEAQKVVDVVDSVNNGHVEITADSSQAVDAVEKVADTTQNISDSHIEITADASQATSEAGKVADVLGSVGDAHSEITADGSQAIDEANHVQDTINSINSKEIDIKVNISEQWMQDIDTVLGHTATKISKRFERVADDASKSFNSKFRDVAAALENVSAHFESGFGAVILGIGAKIGAIVASMTALFSSALFIGGGFEAQMTSVKVISGATEEELEKLTAKAREMGATLPISAKDAATAMTLLAQRGTSVKDILASVSDVANLAISQGVSMGAAADLLGSTITNFGLAMEDASKVTAIFNNASNQSALNMSKLTEAMKYVGPAASSVGMELTEAVSAMEALANAGLPGEMIGTGLAAILTKLATKTRIMGVETKDLNGKMRPLADIVSELRDKEMSLAEANDAVGVRAGRSLLALIKQSAALKENEERLKQWGSTQAAVDEKAKTFTNTMAAFRSALEEIHIEIFDQIKDKSKDTVAGITALTRAFSEWLGQTKLAQKSLEGFLEGLGFNIPTGSEFKQFLDNLNVDMIVEKFKNFGIALKDLGNTILRVKDVIEAPIEFLIKHMETFAKISFWGWIIDKGIAIPAALLRLGDSFFGLASSLKVVLGLNLTSISAFFSSLLTTLSSPILWGGVGIAALGTFVAKQVFEYKEAQETLEEAINQEKKYLQEQAQADSSLDLDIKLNIKTGFEKLPESWTKASDELREKANITVKELRETFKDKVGTAIKEVANKSPEFAMSIYAAFGKKASEAIDTFAGKPLEFTNALNKAIDDLDVSTLSQLTKALQGNKEVFDALSEPMKRVVEQLYYMGVEAGQSTESVGQLLIAWKKLQRQTENNSVNKSNIQLFAEELSASVASLINAIPDNIEKLQSFMDGKNLDLAVNISLEQANSQIKELSKSIGEKFNVPANFVNSEILSQLQLLAEKGNKAAQSLVGGWNASENALDSFFKSAQEAVTYLGVSPEKFSPALNSLTKSIQKIDPLTGKVTEQFKKAYDALKQWGNITFSQLEQRIQRLRKAVEGGFIDQKALEAEFKRASEQVKIQIATELEPSRGQFSSESAFNSVVASEYVSRMGELGGQAFMDLLQKEFDSLYDKSGSAIGSAIMRQVNQGLTSSNGASIKINGVEMLKQSEQSQGSFNYQNFAKAFSDSVNPFISKLEQFNSQQSTSRTDIASRFPEIVSALNKLTSAIENNNSIMGRANDAMLSLVNSIGNINNQNSNNSVAAVRDYSSEFASVVKEIQAVSTGLAAINSSALANVSAVNSVVGAVSAVESAIKAQQNFSPSFDSSAIVQAFVNGVNPFISRLEATGSLYQSSSAAVSKDMLSLSQSLTALKSSTDTNINSMSSLQNAIAGMNSSASGESFSAALTPLVNSVQALSAAVSTIHSVNQANSSAITGITNAVKSVETAIKAINAGNNYDIDINQQGFVIEKKSDADSVARLTASALRSGLGNGGV